MVLSIEGEQAHGSGRSIPAFHLLDALESCAGLFTRFGGHAHAVGFSLPAERVPELKAHLEAYASARLTPEDFVFQLGIAAEIGFADITPELILALEQMQPFGVGNPEPVFTAHSLRVAAPARVLKEKHAKLRLVGGSRGFDALAWGMAERVTAEGLLVNDMLDLAFTLEENKHPEFGGIQLIVKDLRRAQPAVAESGACMASAS
jgi:single-stranded-DNA-specific exonuclease